jgi:hypothetical protein
VVCGLFAVEDIAVIAARQRLRAVFGSDWAAAATIDLALAAAMISYNYAATRFVTGVAGSPTIIWAAGELSGRPSRWRHLDPLRAIRQAVERLGTAGDVVAVNVLGVPGAGMERALRDGSVTRRRTLRLCVLFAVSWFGAAAVIEGVVGGLTALPVAGRAVAQATKAAGTAFATLTDPTGPFGAVVLAVAGVLAARYALRVERLARTRIALTAAGS